MAAMTHVEAAFDPALTEPELAPRERRFIVLLALVQGLLLYVAQYGIENDMWPFDALGGRVYWYTLVLAVPASMMLSLRTLSDPRFWQHAAGVLALYAALSAWAVWTGTGPGFVDASEVLRPFAATLALGSFVGLPYLQARLAFGRWRAPYPFLFEMLWQNVFTLALAAVFVGLGWALLALWGQLFDLIGIDAFERLFREDPFVYLASGTLFGLGVLIGRTQPRPARIARAVLVVLCTGLLPMLVLFSLMFLAALPFTGLDALWKTRHAALILAMVAAFVVVLVNAVRQDGSGDVPYPVWLRRFVDVGLVASPAFPAIALIALWLRIEQYGWTVERFWGVVAVILLAAATLGLAWAALERGGPWLRRLSQVNVALSLAMVALMVLGNSPLLDPYRLATSSQVARFHAAPAEGKLDALDEGYLRWHTGRHGVLALQRLLDDPAVVAAPDRREEIRQALASTERWRWERERPDHTVDVATLRRQLQLAPGTATPDDAWLQALAKRRLEALICLAPGAECLLVDVDADRDGAAEKLLCSLGEKQSLTCWLSARRGGKWVDGGTVQWWRNDGPLPWKAIRSGRVTLEAACWPRIGIGGLEAQAVQGNATPANGCIDVDDRERDR